MNSHWLFALTEYHCGAPSQLGKSRARMGSDEKSGE